MNSTVPFVLRLQKALYNGSPHWLLASHLSCMVGLSSMVDTTLIADQQASQPVKQQASGRVEEASGRYRRDLCR